MVNSDKRCAYFVASMVGKEKYGEFYIKISKLLKDRGYEVWDDINQTNPVDEWEKGNEEISKYFSKVLRKIRDCDIFVAEESHPSSAIGYEIGYAVGNSRPVLILRQENVPGPGVPFRGNPSKLLNVVTYNEDNLESQLDKFIKKAEKGIFVKRLPIEFTGRQVDYVEERQNRAIKKSFNATVREIIEEAIVADESYEA